VGNEENGYPAPHPNKKMTNITNEPSDAHIKILKEKFLEEISGKFMKIIVMVNQNVQYIVKTFQDTKNKRHEKTQKQVNDLREYFNKNQRETKDTIKRYIYIN
jgi:hypothetical protein